MRKPECGRVARRLAWRAATMAAVASLVLQGGAAEEETILYASSFEQPDPGPVEQWDDGDVTWTAYGAAAITDRYQHTGAQCLHLAGGTDNRMELRLRGRLRHSRGFRFQAERWTARDPFLFRIEANTPEGWVQVANLDRLVRVGRAFLSDIVLALPDTELSGLRMLCTAPEGKGVLIDDVRLLQEKPMHVTRAPAVATEPIRRVLHSEPLFVSGTRNTHTFRIPALLTAQNGDLLAVCDARRTSAADLIHVRDIDIAIRRSADNGETWSDMELICDFGDGRPASDPSLILDRASGEIFCFYNTMDQDRAPREFRFYLQRSGDHGRTWGEALDITDQIAKPAWTMDFKFITSGRGVQTRAGELLHTLVRPGRGVHVFGSRDRGRSWNLVTESPLDPGDESKVVELVDGRLMVNCRVNGHGFRWVHRSDAGGTTWQGHSAHSLVDPGCNASIIRYTSVRDGFAKNRLLFSNANSFAGRKNLAVRISYDEGQTWSDGKVIDPGPSAYSSLTICRDGTIGVLYEPGHQEVRFVRFTLEDLTDGRDRLSRPYRLPGPERNGNENRRP